MKKTLLSLIIAAMVVPNVALAAPKSPETKAKRAEFKQQIAPKKQELKNIHDNNTALRKEIKSKRQEIKSIIQSLKKNNDEASKAKLAEVKKELQSLTTTKEALKELKGTGKPYWVQLKANTKSMNLEASLGNIESISNIRNSRTESLTKINTTLDAILAILK